MNSFLADVRRTIVPGTDPRHGPLPPMLLGMTFVTGMVDAFSYLALGHVFVANMTGNVVFLAFALAGAPGFSIGASLSALAAFWCGALIGGRVGSRLGDHRARFLYSAAILQGIFVAAAVIVALASGNLVSTGFRYPLIAVLGIAMGIQNAVARKLAVPDLTTTVLTLTIVGTAADSTLAGGKGSSAGRRLVAVVVMLLGALVGAAFVVHVDVVYPLLLSLIVLSVIVIATRPIRTSDVPWVHPS